MFRDKYASRIALELLSTRIDGLAHQLDMTLLEVAELHEKAYSALKRLEMRQRREDKAEPCEESTGDVITEKLKARRASRGLHEKLSG